MLLGLGTDGHTASLFPGFEALGENRRWVTATPKSLLNPRVRRITLTLPALGDAKRIFFFVSDKDKKDVLEEILTRRPDDDFRYPAELVSPSERPLWFVHTARVSVS